MIRGREGSCKICISFGRGWFTFFPYRSVVFEVSLVRRFMLLRYVFKQGVTFSRVVQISVRRFLQVH